MNNLMIFEGKQVEVFEWNGQVLFNPYHCGECLGLGESAVRMAISKMNSKQVIKLKNSDVNKVDTQNSDIGKTDIRNSNVKDIDFRKLHNTGENFLTESGVYKLIFKSHKEEAERFQDWVTDVVLPSIRRHGMYATDELLNNPDLLIGVATKLKEEREKNKALEEERKTNAPKVIFADAVATSKTSILVGELAKIMKQNGIDIGGQRLFSWLRDNGYLIKRKGTDWNMPTQKSMELKLFEIKESTHLDSNGVNVTTKTPKVTGKGQQYFINKFLNKEG